MTIKPEDSNFPFYFGAQNPELKYKGKESRVFVLVYLEIYYF